jgi:hypothetical protein
MLATSCVAALNTDNILSVISSFKVIDCFIGCNALLAKKKSIPGSSGDENIDVGVLEGSMFLRNFCNYPQFHMSLQP